MRRLLIAALIAHPTLGLAHGEKAQAPHAIDYSKAEQTLFGIAADPMSATRTVRIDMTDAMRFTPSAIMVERGEVVRFVAANKGKVLHEMVLGTMDELKMHAELMKKHPGMEHDEPHMAHVAPGKAGEIGWKFTRAGTFYFGCFIPGHFEAGMIGKVIVK
ncbi:MAG: cupredoxin family protein [Burkholderiales bacterium]